MSLFSLIDFLAVFAGAVGGAAETARDERFDYDVVGVVGLALVSALGGGVTRDVLLGRGIPLAFIDVRYLLFAFAGALVALFFYRHFGRWARLLLLVIDAAALGLYSVAGSTRAVEAGLRWLPALLLGVITAAGGGAWRDVIAGRTPTVFRRGPPYVLVALCASSIYLALRYLHREPWATVGGGGAGFLLRLLVLRFGWQTQAVRATPAPGKTSL